MPYTARQYAGEADYTRMRELLTDIWELTGPPSYGTAGDLDWWRAQDAEEESLRASRLWFAGDELVAFAWPAGDSIDMFSHPAHRAVEAQVLDWFEGRAAGARVSAWALNGDAERRTLLEARGYVPSDVYLICWQRDLVAGSPECRPAAGCSVRGVGEDEALSRVEAHRSAFAPSRFTIEKYRRVQQMPGYRRDLDVVAVAPDGTVAAFCIVWYDARNRAGEFAPDGTHADHRRRGLAAAVMAEGLRRLIGLGARTALVMSAGGREASYRLYESLGFQITGEIRRWDQRGGS